MADEVKSWYKSKGMWAGVLTVAFGVYEVVQANFTNLHLPNLSGFMPIIFVVLGSLGIYGRVGADKKIVFSDKPSN